MIRRLLILWLASRAPVTLEDARRCCGYPGIEGAPLVEDSERSVVMTIHAMMCKEWAEALLWELGQKPRSKKT